MEARYTCVCWSYVLCSKTGNKNFVIMNDNAETKRKDTGILEEIP